MVPGLGLPINRIPASTGGASNLIEDAALPESSGPGMARRRRPYAAPPEYGTAGVKSRICQVGHGEGLSQRLSRE